MKKIYITLLSLTIFLANAGFVLAQTGIINNNFKYAWSDKIGWINFAPTDNNQSYAGLNISDTNVTGFAWSQNFAWINFNPKNGGVKNSDEGNLSGYAFGENLGWINFSGVTINCDGKFSGKASGDNVGTINFDCANCVVKTNWLPVSCDKKNHNECNEQSQCISVLGSGDNQCQTDSDCALIPPTITETPKNPVLPTEIVGGINDVVVNIKEIIETPLASIITKAISTTALVGGAIAVGVVTLFSNVSLVEVFLSPIRLFGAVMTLFGIRKRTLPWGVVYDSVTKQPLDPAYVILKDEQGNDKANAITDIDGRFGFLVEPGSYFITSQKTNYAFPSKKLFGRGQDEIYNNLYFGEKIKIEKLGEVITKNIPLDPIKFDWNEFAKKNKSFMKFYSRWDALLRKISDLFFAVGFIVAIVSFIFAPYPYNTIIFVLYLLVLLLRVLGIKPKTLGYVRDKITGDPLSFAIIRIMMPSANIEISHKVTDAYGRYYCLIPRGKYYLKIEKKNIDGSYTLIHTSPIIDASKKGIINNKFEV